VTSAAGTYCCGHTQLDTGLPMDHAPTWDDVQPLPRLQPGLTGQLPAPYSAELCCRGCAVLDRADRIRAIGPPLGSMVREDLASQLVFPQDNDSRREALGSSGREQILVLHCSGDPLQ
jgi:hypothetical protein